MEPHVSIQSTGSSVSVLKGGRELTVTLRLMNV